MAESPLDRLLAEPGVSALTNETAEAFVNTIPADGVGLVFFTGGKDRRREANDVAVVLRELRRSHGDRLLVGLVTGDDEKPLKPVFGVLGTPCLVLLRDGGVVDVIPKIQDWAVYADRTAACLAGSGVAQPLKFATDQSTAA